MNQIYMDYAATTPVDEKVLKDMLPYFSEKFGNSSSIHKEGEEAQKGVLKARQTIADFLKVNANEIIFTSGATEGNNMAIKGFVFSFKVQSEYKKPHIIVGSTEHDCVIESAKRIKKDGLAEVSFAEAQSDGRINPETIAGLIKDNTALVSVMYANNETGVINPVKEIGRIIKKFNSTGRKRIYFHTDACQAINYLNCEAEKLGVDLLTISSHKIYGPKGIGALYVKKGTPLLKLMDGGEQEFKLRAGTHNTPCIVGFGSAVLRVGEYEDKNKEIEGLRNKLIDGILSSVPDSFLNGSREHRLPNNANIRFKGAEGEAILTMLDGKGVSVSTGSACAAKSLNPSHVLKAMGLSDLETHSSVRFSLGRSTEEKDIDYVISVLPEIIVKLRKISGSIG